MLNADRLVSALASGRCDSHWIHVRWFASWFVALSKTALQGSWATWQDAVSLSYVIYYTVYPMLEDVRSWKQNWRNPLHFRLKPMKIRQQAAYPLFARLSVWAVPLCELVSPLPQDHMGETTEIQRITAVTRAAKHPSPDSDGIYTDFGFFKARAMEMTPVAGMFGKRIHGTASVQLEVLNVFLINYFWEYKRFHYTSAFLWDWAFLSIWFHASAPK